MPPHSWPRALRLVYLDAVARDELQAVREHGGTPQGRGDRQRNPARSRGGDPRCRYACGDRQRRGPTGTYNICGAYPGITEVQAGSYPTMDARYYNFLPEFKHAMTLVATVVSHMDENRIIVDSGLKVLTSKFGMPQPYGVKGATLLKLSEEHGAIDLSNPDREFRIGRPHLILPTHGCTTINLHDKFYVIRGDEVVDIWSVAGRGKSQ